MNADLDKLDDLSVLELSEQANDSLARTADALFTHPELPELVALYAESRRIADELAIEVTRRVGEQLDNLSRASRWW